MGFVEGFVEASEDLASQRGGELGDSREVALGEGFCRRGEVCDRRVGDDPCAGVAVEVELDGLLGEEDERCDAGDMVGLGCEVLKELVKSVGLLTGGVEGIVEDVGIATIGGVKPVVGAELDGAAPGKEVEEKDPSGREEEGVDVEEGVVEGQKTEVQPGSIERCVGELGAQEVERGASPFVYDRCDFNPLLRIHTARSSPI